MKLRTTKTEQLRRPLAREVLVTLEADPLKLPMKDDFFTKKDWDELEDSLLSGLERPSDELRPELKLKNFGVELVSLSFLDRTKFQQIQTNPRVRSILSRLLTETKPWPDTPYFRNNGWDEREDRLEFTGIMSRFFSDLDPALESEWTRLTRIAQEGVIDVMPLLAILDPHTAKTLNPSWVQPVHKRELAAIDFHGLQPTLSHMAVNLFRLPEVDRTRDRELANKLIQESRRFLLGRQGGPRLSWGTALPNAAFARIALAEKIEWDETGYVIDGSVTLPPIQPLPARTLL